MTRRTLLKLAVLLPLVGPGIAKVLTKPKLKPAPGYAPYLPAGFPKWNQTIDGLEDAGSWVLSIERSRLPQDMMFPQVGQVWEAVGDCDVGFRANITFRQPQPGATGVPKGVAPVQGPVVDPAGSLGCMMPSAGQLLARPHRPVFFPFGGAQLTRGERVRITSVDGPPPIFVHFQPLRYHELQAAIVPEDLRKLPGYSGYVLSLKTARTISDFALAKKIRQTWFIEAFKLVKGVA